MEIRAGQDGAVSLHNHLVQGENGSVNAFVSTSDGDLHRSGEVLLGLGHGNLRAGSVLETDLGDTLGADEKTQLSRLNGQLLGHQVNRSGGRSLGLLDLGSGRSSDGGRSGDHIGNIVEVAGGFVALHLQLAALNDSPPIERRVGRLRVDLEIVLSGQSRGSINGFLLLNLLSLFLDLLSFQASKFLFLSLLGLLGFLNFSRHKNFRGQALLFLIVFLILVHRHRLLNGFHNDSGDGRRDNLSGNRFSGFNRRASTLRLTLGLRLSLRLGRNCHSRSRNRSFADNFRLLLLLFGRFQARRKHDGKARNHSTSNQ
mmetsp:Transcript_46748/g.81695  ORF Transcript_46748/g.81695 Transcript_46748/m.81695 type:complete len:314 (-) Transcript_46748:73-1014(-)